MACACAQRGGGAGGGSGGGWGGEGAEGAAGTGTAGSVESWVYDQALQLLLKLYREPSTVGGVGRLCLGFTGQIGIKVGVHNQASQLLCNPTGLKPHPERHCLNKLFSIKTS